MSKIFGNVMQSLIATKKLMMKKRWYNIQGKSVGYMFMSAYAIENVDHMIWYQVRFQRSWSNHIFD